MMARALLHQLYVMKPKLLPPEFSMQLPTPSLRNRENGGHLQPVTLKPVSRIFRVLRVLVSAFSAFSKPKKERFENFRGRSPELVPEPPFPCKYYTKAPIKGVPEQIPDSFPKSSRTSLSSVWFAGATPEFSVFSAFSPSGIS